ncbi:DUF1542 domain-containing protein, partial [Lactobacillus sp. B4007]|uniref:DUF1542 domain-containing protein n=1 Tax=Lactobacillus sp. B4007 TaxID=2818032 RepID=UPI00226A44E3
MKRNYLIKEIKNTNYKMHKSKKGWLVSYSLLTFMLGGLLFGSAETQQVKAAELENSTSKVNSPKRPTHQKIDLDSVEKAKQNELAALETEASLTKQKINGDKVLGLNERSEEIKNVDNLLEEAKVKINSAESIVNVKSLTDDYISRIKLSYKTRTANGDGGNSNTLTDDQKIKNKKDKPKLSTYSGLSTFLGQNSGSQNNSKTAENKNEESLIDSSSKIQQSVKVGSDDSDTDKDISVASANDDDRDKFNNELDKNQSTTPTSVTVATPDEVTNPDKYKTSYTKKEVSDFRALANAWNNSTGSLYIDITADLKYDGISTLNPRGSRANVIINGNGHTVDLGRQSFSYAGNIEKSNPSTLTITNTNFIQGFDGVDWNSFDLVNANTSRGFTLNIDNVTLKGPDNAPNLQPCHVLFDEYGTIVFSGTNKFYITNEITRGVSHVYFANNSHVLMQRVTINGGESRNSEFWYSVRDGNTNLNTFTMGDGSSNTAISAPGIIANYPALYQLVDTVKVGDNVKWEQDGYQYFLNQSWALSSGTYRFGQNFDLEAPSTTRSNAIYLIGNQTAKFGAGAILNINQKANDGSIIRVDGNSQVIFTSPKQLHLAVQDSYGNAATTGYGIISGTGSVTLNNSSIRSWNGSNSSELDEAGDNSSKFSQMTVRNGQTTIKSFDNTSSISDIITSRTRELQTNAIKPGTIKIQYVNQNGLNIGSPISISLPKDAYIGEFIPLINKDIVIDKMPNKYMWALGNQVFSGAKDDHQSLGEKNNSNDDGDSNGQAEIGIVPMEGQVYTYKIYVYGTPQKVTYRYVDYNTNRTLTSPLSGVSGNETIGGVTPANYGNEIDWTNSYYTQDNVPSGYVYSTTAKTENKQPGITKVTDSNPVVVIYVEGKQQKIPVSYVSLNGDSVNPVTAVNISGATGETITLPAAPEAYDSGFDHIELNGITVQPGYKFDMPDQSGLASDKKYSIRYVYHSINKERNIALNEINSSATAAKINIENDSTITDSVKQSQKKIIDDAVTDAKSKINSDNLPSLIDKDKQDALSIIRNAHKGSKTIEEQRVDAKGAIDRQASITNKSIDDDKTLTTAEKNDQKAAVAKDVTDAKANIDNATNAQGISNARDAGVNKIQNDYQTSKTSLAEQKTNAISAIDRQASITNKSIDDDKTLSKAEKDAQKTAVAKDVTDAEANINNASDAQGILDAKNTGVEKIKNDYQTSKTSLDEQKTNARSAIETQASTTNKLIDDDNTLTTAEKNDQKAAVAKDVTEAEANINNASDAQGILDAQGAGIEKIKNAYQTSKISLAKQKTNAISAIETQASITNKLIDDDNTLTTAEKNDQKTAVIQDVVDAKANIGNASDAQGILDAQNTGVEKIKGEYHSSKISLAKQKTNAISAIETQASTTNKLIDDDKTLTTAEKDAQKAAVAKDVTEAEANINNASDAQGILDA